MIAVLPPALPAPLLAAVRREVEDRGWSCEVSAGAEQTLLVVAGPTRPDELATLLPPELEADVVPIRSGKHYRRAWRKRRLLNAIAWGLTLVIVLGLGTPAWLYLRSAVSGPATDDLLPAGAAGRLPVHSAKVVRSDGTAVLLVHLQEQRYFAVDALCTYVGDCLLEFDPERLQVTCPCHGCIYDVHGNVVAGPPSIPLASYPVERVDAQVFVRVGRRR